MNSPRVPEPPPPGGGVAAPAGRAGAPPATCRGEAARVALRVASLALLGALAAAACDPRGATLFLDLHAVALLGQPRLLGFVGFGEAALVVLAAIAGVTLVDLGERVATWRRGAPPAPTARATRRATLLLAAWGGLAALLLLEVVLAWRPALLPAGACVWLPFNGAAELAWGPPWLEPQPDIMVRHRPGSAYVARIDHGRDGDLARRGLVRVDAARSPSRRIAARRAYDADGLLRFDGAAGAAAPRALVVLGDSFSVGYGLPPRDVWPAVAAERLAAAGRPARLRVIACAAWSPAESLAAWDRFGHGGAPPADVVVQFFEGNDLGDLVAHAARRRRGEDIATRPRRMAALLPAGVRATRHLRALYGWLVAPTDLRMRRELRAAAWFARREFVGVPDAARPARLLRGAEEDLARLARRELHLVPPFAAPLVVHRAGGAEVAFGLDPQQFYAAYGTWDEEREEAVALLGAALDGVASRAREAGARATLLYVPTVMTACRDLGGDVRAELDPALLRFLVETTPGHAHWARAAFERWERREDAVRERVRAAAEARGIAFLDATGALAEATRAALAGAGPLPFFPWDTHLAPEGQRAVGELVAAHLLAERTIAGPGAADPDARE